MSRRRIVVAVVVVLAVGLLAVVAVLLDRRDGGSRYRTEVGGVTCENDDVCVVSFNRGVDGTLTAVRAPIRLVAVTDERVTIGINGTEYHLSRTANTANDGPYLWFDLLSVTDSVVVIEVRKRSD